MPPTSSIRVNQLEQVSDTPQEEQENTPPTSVSVTSTASSNSSRRMIREISRGVSLSGGLEGLQPPCRKKSNASSLSTRSSVSTASSCVSLHDVLDMRMRQVDLAIDCVGEFQFEYHGLQVLIQPDNDNDDEQGLVISSSIRIPNKTKLNDKRMSLLATKIKEWNTMLMSDSFQMKNNVSVELNKRYNVQLQFHSKAEREPPFYQELEKDIHIFFMGALQLREEVNVFLASKPNDNVRASF